ncbi:hypothetical protein AB0E08_07805 [Streptomyces sp. NPDC048281]|uniref:hypothetical protein n=1 Tax=Streptomyces sp. NPDC048281 TaxID=3154715 RepID=UPI00343C7B83
MSMSDHERALLVTGTLDTSGVGGSPYANLDRVAVAFGAEVFEGNHIPQEMVTVTVKVSDETEQKAAENGPSEPVKEPEQEDVKEPEAAKEPEPVVATEKPATAHRTTKRPPAKKAQASAPAEK